MIVREFLWWMRQAPADMRAEATRDLVESYLWGELEESDRDAAEAAMVSLLDDPSPAVRLALAECLANHEQAPRSVISGLAHDYAEIAGVVLEHSPVLSDGELIEIIEVSNQWHHAAIASRLQLSVFVAESLVRYASSDICLSLLARPELAQSSQLIDLVLSRFGDVAEVSEALHQLGGLTQEQHVMLVSNTADRLQNFITMTGWIKPEKTNRMMRDCSDRAFLITLKNANSNQLLDAIITLQAANKLTPSLLLRAIMSGQRAFFDMALAYITGLDLARISGLLKEKSGRAVQALLAKAGIPEMLVPPFEIILNANIYNSKREGLNLQATTLVLNDYQQHGSYCDRSVLSLLQHFNTEAARDEARFYTSDLMRDPNEFIMDDHTMSGWNEAPEASEFSEQPANDIEPEVDALELFKQEMQQKQMAKAA
jgi:uncharacterized protein (DUF2336 family)